MCPIDLMFKCSQKAPDEKKKEGRLLAPLLMILAHSGQEHLAQKTLCTLLLRMLKYLRRRSGLNDESLIHEDNTVGDFLRKTNLMCDDNHRHALVCKFDHHVEDLMDQLHVNGGRRLVEQHELRVHGKRTRYGHPLLLTTTHLSRLVTSTMRQTDLRQKFHCLSLSRFSSHLLDGDRPQSNVLKSGEVRKHVELLKHHANVFSQSANVILACLDELAVECYAASRWGL